MAEEKEWMEKDVEDIGQNGKNWQKKNCWRRWEQQDGGITLITFSGLGKERLIICTDVDKL